MSNSLLLEIEKQYDKLSKSHKKIADYILNNYDKAAFYTAAKLGKVTNISESTVVRFATCLGFQGYPEFQEAFKKAVIAKLTSMQRMEVASFQMKDEDILTKVLTRDVSAIKDTLHDISRKDFEGASAAINSASKIYILGVRSCAPLASFIYFYLKMVYDNVVLINSASSSEMFEQIFKITKDDICIALSFPRYSKQVVKTLHYVHDRGARIVAITDSDEAPIAHISDYILTAKSNMASFVDSLVAPLSLVNALMVSATANKRAEVEERFNELEKVWEKYDVYETQEDMINE